MTTQSAQPKRKLLDQACTELCRSARAVLREKHYSIHTEHTYVDWMRRFIRFHHKRHPRDMGAPEIAAFLTHLAVDHRVAASTQQQALSALLFLYREVLDQEPGPVLISALRPKRPDHLPAAILTREEVSQVIAALPVPDERCASIALVVQLLYGAGLRLIECLRLRVGDVDLTFHQILVRGEKGRPDHVTVLPQSLVAPLQEQIERAAALHRQDLADGYGAVYLPPAIEEEYPAAVGCAASAREWRWQYVFPADERSVDPRSGVTRRHHLGPSGPQKAVRQAALSTGIPKPIHCRAFRDAFAAHLLAAGYTVRTVQELLGHKDVGTTLDRYTHVLNRPGPPILSPLDR